MNAMGENSAADPDWIRDSTTRLADWIGTKHGMLPLRDSHLLITIGAILLRNNPSADQEGDGAPRDISRPHIFTAMRTMALETLKEVEDEDWVLHSTMLLTNWMKEHEEILTKEDQSELLKIGATILCNNPGKSGRMKAEESRNAKQIPVVSPFEI